jgi:hypothetical protein
MLGLAQSLGWRRLDRRGLVYVLEKNQGWDLERIDEKRPEGGILE